MDGSRRFYRRLYDLLFRKSDFKWFLGFVPILIIVFASLPEQRVSFAGKAFSPPSAAKSFKPAAKRQFCIKPMTFAPAARYSSTGRFSSIVTKTSFCFPPPFCSGYVGLLGNHSRNMGHLFGLLVNFSHPRLPVIMFSASATVQKRKD